MFSFQFFLIKKLTPCSEGTFVMFNVFLIAYLSGNMYFVFTRLSNKSRAEENLGQRNKSQKGFSDFNFFYCQPPSKPARIPLGELIY